MDSSSNFMKRYLPQLTVTGLVLLFVVVLLWNEIVIKIKAGEVGVLYDIFQGTIVNETYDEGIHLIFPWNTMNIYNRRIQRMTGELDVLAESGLTLHLVFSVRFAPVYDLIGVLHQEIGPDYVEKIVMHEIEAVMRKEIGAVDAEEFYSKGESITQRIYLQAFDQLGQKYVRLDDVVISKVVLPKEVQASIELKIREKHKWQEYEFRLEREKREKERKEIASEGIQRYNENVAKSLTDSVLTWAGVQATLELSRSPNTKVVIVGSGENGLPIILGNVGETTPTTTEASARLATSLTEEVPEFFGSP